VEVAKSLWLVVALIYRARMIVLVWLLGELSAVDEQSDARDEAGPGTAEPQDGGGDLVGTSSRPRRIASVD
jgi:hypothetical protein